MVDTFQSTRQTSLFLAHQRRKEAAAIRRSTGYPIPLVSRGPVEVGPVHGCPYPPHRTGREDFPHPAPSEDLAFAVEAVAREARNSAIIPGVPSCIRPCSLAQPKSVLPSGTFIRLWLRLRRNLF